MLAEEQPLTVKRVSYDSSHHWEEQGQGGAILDHCEEHDSQETLIPSPHMNRMRSPVNCVLRGICKRGALPRKRC